MIPTIYIIILLYEKENLIKKVQKEFFINKAIRLLNKQ